MGAVRMTQRSKWVDPRAKRYEAYKRRVRLVANVNGVPSEIAKDERIKLEVDVCWRKLARADLDNVVKGLLDALFGQDRRVNSIRADHQEYCELDMADIALTVECLPKEAL